MRGFGFLVLIVGVLVLIVGASMDVTVATSAGSRVYNIGLMNERSNLFTFGGIACLIGVLMVLFGGRRQSDHATTPTRELRPCPYCAEPILRQAIKCKHCGSEVEPQKTPPLTHGWSVRITCKKPEELEQVQEKLSGDGYPIVGRDGADVIVGYFPDSQEAKLAQKSIAFKHGLHGDLNFARA